jgi:DNA-binding Lrp family transcriptional regulator
MRDSPVDSIYTQAWPSLSASPGAMRRLFGLWLHSLFACEESDLVTSIILINAERTHINDVAERLVEISSISEVYSVSGNYDLIAIVRVKSNDELSDLVTNKMKEIDGITRTESMLAFRAYSRHDLDAMFSL